MLVRSVLLALLLGAVMAPPAQACESGPSATFHADFRSPGPGWQTAGDRSYFLDGQLVVKPPANRGQTATMELVHFNSATYCVQIKMPADLASDSSTGAGLVFWKVDADYFEVAISPDRTYGFNRLVNNSWNSILPRTKFDKINSGPGAVNEVKVVTHDGHVTAYLNGEKAFEAIAQAPPGGGGFGAYAESVEDKRTEWRFLDLVVVADVVDPVGHYALSGAISGGGKYDGSVTVEKAGDGYRVLRTAGGKSSEGVGIVSDNRLSAAFPGGKEPAVAAYVRTDQGWSGTVIAPTAPTAVGNLNETVALETWTRN
jgi:hypothetical protein